MLADLPKLVESKYLVSSVVAIMTLHFEVDLAAMNE